MSIGNELERSIEREVTKDREDDEGQVVSPKQRPHSLQAYRCNDCGDIYDGEGTPPDDLCDDCREAPLDPETSSDVVEVVYTYVGGIGGNFREKHRARRVPGEDRVVVESTECCVAETSEDDRVVDTYGRSILLGDDGCTLKFDESLADQHWIDYVNDMTIRLLRARFEAADGDVNWSDVEMDVTRK
jgi:hypothetical protein